MTQVDLALADKDSIAPLIAHAPCQQSHLSEAAPDSISKGSSPS